MHLSRWLNLSKFLGFGFLGGPNGPKICGGRTKTEFKDRADNADKSLSLEKKEKTIMLKK